MSRMSLIKHPNDRHVVGLIAGTYEAANSSFYDGHGLQSSFHFSLIGASCGY